MKRIAPFAVVLMMLASMMVASPSSEVRAQTGAEECAYYCVLRADQAEAEAIALCRAVQGFGGSGGGYVPEGDCAYFGATVWASVALECYAGCF